MIYEAQPVLQQQFAALMERAAQMTDEEEQRQQQQKQQAGAAPTAAAAQEAEEAALQAEVERVRLHHRPMSACGAFVAAPSPYLAGPPTMARWAAATSNAYAACLGSQPTIDDEPVWSAPALRCFRRRCKTTSTDWGPPSESATSLAVGGACLCTAPPRGVRDLSLRRLGCTATLAVHCAARVPLVYRCQGPSTCMPCSSAWPCRAIHAAGMLTIRRAVQLGQQAGAVLVRRTQMGRPGSEADAHSSLV